MAHLCKQNTLSLSVDNKNKVEVGIPATSRRANIRTFHLTNQAPIYNDHDFPNPNSKLVPAGYQVLRHPVLRSRSLSPPAQKLVKRKRSLSEGECFTRTEERTEDKLGRKKIKWPRLGQLYLQLYASRLIESTNVMHANHLLHYIKRERAFKDIANVVAIADGGPDWSVKGIINFLSMGLLWMNLKLDTFIIQCYAPGHSRFNPIERTWSHLTNKIVTVTLPDDIDGVKPAYNDYEGWMKVLDNAVDVCARFWHNKEYCGIPVLVETFKSNNPLVPHLRRTHQLLKDFTNASAKKLASTPEYDNLRDTYTLLVKHANRKSYQLEFVRCQDRECGHCQNLPKRVENEFLSLIRQFGGSCPSPQQSEVYSNHYKTFLEMLRVRSSRDKQLSKITKWGTCKKGCQYMFFSDADEKRHMRLMRH